MKSGAGLIGPIFIVLATFFLLCPVLSLTISLFTSQKKFADIMVEKGIVSAEDVKLLHPKKQIAGVLFSAILLAIIVSACVKTGWMTVLSVGIAFVFGMVKNRKVFPVSSFTADRFKTTYAGKYNEAKFKKYISETF